MIFHQFFAEAVHKKTIIKYIFHLVAYQHTFPAVGAAVEEGQTCPVAASYLVDLRVAVHALPSAAAL